MESINEFYRKNIQDNNEAIIMKQLVNRWYKKVNDFPTSKLKKLKFWKNVHPNTSEKVIKKRSLIENLSIKTTPESSPEIKPIATFTPRIESRIYIKEIKFVVHLRVNFGFSLGILGSSEVFGNWNPSNS